MTIRIYIVPPESLTLTPNLTPTPRASLLLSLTDNFHCRLLLNHRLVKKPYPSCRPLDLAPNMDPFTITALVCSIISAFTGAAQLFQGRKKKDEAAVSLQRSLEIAPPQVQREYDDDFRQLGARFGTGDGKSPGSLRALKLSLV